MYCTKMGIITGYNSAFLQILLKYADISPLKALNRYTEGLKNEPRAWVQMQGISTLDLAM